MKSCIEKDLLAGRLDSAGQWELASVVNCLAGRVSRKAEAPSLNEIRIACKTLNALRQYELCRVLADAWTNNAPPDMQVMKHLIQALINLSMLDEAEKLLVKSESEWALIADSTSKSKEKEELLGLAARICKQRFVELQDPDELERAYKAYLKVYRINRQNFWIGVNVVALGARAMRERLKMNSKFPVLLARHLVVALIKEDDGDPWRLAALSELSLALGDCDAAELWLYRFLHAPKTNPFMLESYDRQLMEIWEGRPLQGGRRCQDRLATIMASYQIARLSNLSITAQGARQLRGADLEKVFSDVGSFTVDMVRRMLDACQSIGCVSNQCGVRLGTGFVLAASEFGGTSGDRLFVTNAHVLSDTVPGAIPIKNALVSFELGPEACGKPKFYQVSELIYTSDPGSLGESDSPNGHLDVTIVRLESLPESIRGLQVASTLPLIDGTAKAYVIGHPRGSGLQISIHDSELLACDGNERLIHYRTPTDPGSSGSPVFNEAWQLIALHHGGSHKMPRLKPALGFYEANEGVTLSAIRNGVTSEGYGITAMRWVADRED